MGNRVCISLKSFLCILRVSCSLIIFDTSNVYAHLHECTVLVLVSSFMQSINEYLYISMLPSLPLSANIDPLTLSLALNEDYLDKCCYYIYPLKFLSDNLNISKQYESATATLNLSILEGLALTTQTYSLIRIYESAFT